VVAVKAQDADRTVASPPAGIAFFLVYGPDAGLVAERSARLAATFADPSDPFSLIRLEAGLVADDPSRLADEAYAVSMFGGRRAIVISNAGSRPSLAEILTPLLRKPPPETAIVVEGGDLKKTSPVRTLFERDKAACAIPCYEDDGAAVGRLVDEEMRAHGLRITPAARALLVSSLGGDRLLSRSEIGKLCLYAAKAGTVDVDDVLQTVVDSASIAVDDVIDATVGGDLQALELALSRAAR
jgi:DNA polymerase III subunit delta